MFVKFQSSDNIVDRISVLKTDHVIASYVYCYKVTLICIYTIYFVDFIVDCNIYHCYMHL